MDLPIVNTGIKLFLSPVFLQQVESIVEDIGVISFIPISDSSSHMQYIAVEQIDWTFSTSYFFHVFTTE